MFYFLPTLATLAAIVCFAFFVVLGILRVGVNVFGMKVDAKYLALDSAIVSGSIAFAGAYLVTDFPGHPIGVTVNDRAQPSAPSARADVSPADSGKAAAPAATNIEREASRLFAGPNQYPPADFAAYGIVAFSSRAAPNDRDLYIMMCEAYVAVLPHESELALPNSAQMVTVWPMSSDSAAIRINRAHRDEVCDQAVDGYGLVVATQALKDAAKVGADVSGRGPYLLAWSPSTQKGKADALVLVANLSNVTTADEAKLGLLRWKKDILEDSAIWNNGWNQERVRIAMREWADQFGSKILSLFGVHQ